jgi:hypothetical protein
MLLLELFAWVIWFFLLMVFFTSLVGWYDSIIILQRKPVSPCNPYPLGLHPEAITFFDLKSQNKNCFQVRARNFPSIANCLGSGRESGEFGVWAYITYTLYTPSKL